MKKIVFFLLLVLIVSQSGWAQTIIPGNGNILYVKKGGTGNGSSWSSPLGELGYALKWAAQNEQYRTEAQPLQVWVAEGTYWPIYNADDTNFSIENSTSRDRAFVIVKNLKLYGNFKGNETHVEDRSFKDYKTILSGDFGNDKAYHVVVNVASDARILIDGFVIEKGNADGQGSISVAGNSIARSNGGGLVSTTPEKIEFKFKNSVFRSNTAKEFGGALYISSGAKEKSSIDFDYSEITENKSNVGAAGYFNFGNTSNGSVHVKKCPGRLKMA